METGLWNILDKRPRRGVEEEDGVETLDIGRMYFRCEIKCYVPREHVLKHFAWCAFPLDSATSLRISESE